MVQIQTGKQTNLPQYRINREVNPINPQRLGRISVDLSDRWALVGMTGCGKTTLARELIDRLRAAYPGVRTYLLDTKLAGDFDKYTGQKFTNNDVPGVLHSAGGLQIWQPQDDDIPDAYNRWFKSILQHRKPAIVLIDELSQITNKRGDAPEYYKRLNKLGRAFGISLITLTQEAAYIPRQTLGQTTHLVRFRLLDGYDVQKIDKMLARPREDQGKELPHAYGFIYRRIDKADPGYYYKNHQEFLGKD